MLATNLALLLLTVAQVANSVPASGPSCEPARNLVTSLKLAHAASESPVSGTRFPISDTYSFLSFARSLSAARSRSEISLPGTSLAAI